MVEATDISESQLANAVEKDNIRYSVAAAEHTLFPDNSFDLITVAQAYHWIDAGAFAREARRVGRPGATVAVWMYNRFTTGAAPLDKLFDHFYRDITGPYWDKERAHVDANYETVSFPFNDRGTARFAIETAWTREQAAGYLSSWSAVQTYIKTSGASPIDIIRDEMERAWPDGVVLSIEFPVVMLYGKI
jgi:ubiquinone/menaquinone biosynthesis C-methylase UbiE